MKFYAVVYQCEDTPDGFAREFFTSRRAATQHVVEVKRGHAEQTAKAQALCDAGNYADAYYPHYHVDHIRIDELEFHGTCKDMVLQALRQYGV